MFIILLVIFAILAIGDNGLTLYGIKYLGLREKNPIMRPIVKIPWLSWIIVTVVIVVVGYLCHSLLGSYYWAGIGILAGACIFKALPVLHNLKLHIMYNRFF